MDRDATRCLDDQAVARRRSVAEMLARLRESRTGARFRRLRGADDECGMPWTTAVDPWSHDFVEGEGSFVSERVIEARPVEALVVEEPTAPAASVRQPPAVDVEREEALVDALHRIADTFETIAENLEIDRRERQAHVEAIEVLLRELVTGIAQPTAVPPIIVGGSIDLNAANDPADDLAERA